MGVLESNVLYIQNRFPEVNTIYASEGVLFQGRFIIEAQYNGFVVQIAPLLELFIPDNYPLRLPLVNDVDNVITYDHKFSNGDLCVSTVFDLQLKLLKSKCISDYIDGFFIPFFISYKYWEDTGEDIFGDRKHGLAGVFESIQEFLCISKDGYFLFKTLICWASKTKRFKKCVSRQDQLSFIRKYSTKISILRRLGILRLKAIYKLLKLCENTSVNLENNAEAKRLYDIACS